MFIVWGSGGTQLSCSNSPTLLLLDWLMRSTVRSWAEEVIGSTPTLPLGLWWPFCWRHVSAIIMLTDTQAYMMSPTGGSNVPASAEASYTQCPRAHAKDLIIVACALNSRCVDWNLCQTNKVGWSPCTKGNFNKVIKSSVVQSDQKVTKCMLES